MTSLQEYDLEFKPSHIVKGHRLCKLTTEATNHQNTELDRLTQEMEGWEHEIKMCQNEILGSHDTSSCYSYVKKYLVKGSLPEAMSARQKRVVRLKVASYQMVQGNLFRKHHLGILLRCLEYDEA